MKVKTSELSGAALDRVVAKCAGIKLNEGNTLSNDCDVYAPSTDWAQGGLIIEREGISVYFENGDWYAKAQSKPVTYYDSSPLVAAMRSYVASKLGDEVEVPDELLQGESK